jgi:hypothetical protein
VRALPDDVVRSCRESQIEHVLGGMTGAREPPASAGGSCASTRKRNYALRSTE